MGDTPPHMKAVRPELRDELRHLHKRVEQVDQRNQDDHTAIMAQIVELISDKKALRVVGVILGFVLGSLVGLVLWAADRIDEVEDGAQQHEAEGMEIGRGLRRDVDRLQRYHGIRPEKDED